MNMGAAKRKKDAGTYFGQPGWAPEQNPKPASEQAALLNAESPEEVHARAKVRRILSALAGIAIAGELVPPSRRR